MALLVISDQVELTPLDISESKAYLLTRSVTSTIFLSIAFLHAALLSGRILIKPPI